MKMSVLSLVCAYHSAKVEKSKGSLCNYLEIDSRNMDISLEKIEKITLEKIEKITFVDIILLKQLLYISVQ